MQFFECVFFMLIGAFIASASWGAVWRYRSDLVRKDISDQIYGMRRESSVDFVQVRDRLITIQKLLESKA